MRDESIEPETGFSAADLRPTASRPNRWTVLYPNLYTWFILVASLDIMCTYIVLHPVLFPASIPPTAAPMSDDLDTWLNGSVESRGREENWLAAWVIEHGGMPGKVTYKFSLVMLVIGICEIVGRRKPEVGRRLAEWAIAITVIPVAVAILEIYRDIYGI